MKRQVRRRAGPSRRMARADRSHARSRTITTSSRGAQEAAAFSRLRRAGAGCLAPDLDPSSTRASGRHRVPRLHDGSLPARGRSRRRPMRAGYLFIACIACAAAALSACNQDSYQSSVDRDTHMGAFRVVAPIIPPATPAAPPAPLTIPAMPPPAVAPVVPPAPAGSAQPAASASASASPARPGPPAGPGPRPRPRPHP